MLQGPSSGISVTILPLWYRRSTLIARIIKELQKVDTTMLLRQPVRTTLARVALPRLRSLSIDLVPVYSRRLVMTLRVRPRLLSTFPKSILAGRSIIAPLYFQAVRTHPGVMSLRIARFLLPLGGNPLVQHRHTPTSVRNQTTRSAEVLFGNQALPSDRL